MFWSKISKNTELLRSAKKKHLEDYFKVLFE